jgi:hypothetical protein
MPEPGSAHHLIFVVASQNVGFHIYNLRSFRVTNIKFSSTWGNGGAHWQSKSEKYFREEAQQQTEIKGCQGSRRKLFRLVIDKW